MDKKKPQTYTPLIRNLGQLCAIIRLYKLNHPMVKDKISQLFTEVSKIITDTKSLTFSETEGVFLVNGGPLSIKDGPIKRFVENFNKLQLGSLELELGLNLEEFRIFMYLVTQREGLEGEDKIKQYLKERGVKHITPLFACYKLVREDQRVVKEGGILKIDQLPPGLIERFKKDLEKDEIGERLKKEEKFYKLLAHDSHFLSSLVFDSVKKENRVEDFEKIIWMIGDYLIDEIGSARVEKINQKVLDEIESRLLSLWEQRKDKERWKQETQKNFPKISAAMQLKGLMLLYGKHKKGLETTAGKLKAILEDLPRESRLYQKTKKNLEKIGAPSLDADIFR